MNGIWAMLTAHEMTVTCWEVVKEVGRVLVVMKVYLELLAVI